MGLMPPKLRRWLDAGALVVREQARPVIDATGWGLLYLDQRTGKLRIYTLRGGDRTLEQAAGGGSGDVVGPASSVASEVALFDGTTGKLLKRAAITGLAKLTSGVLSAATAGTDYYAPGSTDVAIADGGTGASTAGDARTNLGLGTAAVLNAAATRAASGLLQLDSAGWFGLDAALAAWRYSVSIAHFSNNTASGYGFTVSPAGTSGTPSTLAYSRREATANSGWFVSSRLASLTIGFAFALIFKLPSSVTSRRLWIGLGSTTMSDSDTAAGSFVGVRYSTVAGDAGFMPASRDGTTQTIGTAGSAPVADVPYMLTIQAATGGSSVAVKITRLDTGATVLDVTISATLPASGTAIDWLLYNHGQGTTRAVEIAQAVRLMGLT